MSRRSLLLILILILILILPALACGETNAPPSQLTAVEVSPSSGSGSFTVSVYYIWDEADPDFSISCTYPGPPTGYPMTDSIPINHEDMKAVFTISVNSPGSYAINCQDSEGKVASTQFTVITATEPTGQATRIVEFSHATITFNGDQIRFDTLPAENPTAAWLEGYCWPPQDFQNNGNSYFTVGADGTLTGKCTVDTDSDHILGELSGSYDEKNGNVIFKLVASHIWIPVGDEANGHRLEVSFEGNGKLIDNLASDTANFTVKCYSYGNSTCIHDAVVQSLKYTGTIPFTIAFLP